MAMSLGRSSIWRSPIQVASFETLRELFPQVDARIIKATVLDHGDDLDSAIDFILNEVIPGEDCSDIAASNIVDIRFGETSGTEGLAGADQGTPICGIQQPDEDDSPALFPRKVDSMFPNVGQHQACDNLEEENYALCGNAGHQTYNFVEKENHESYKDGNVGHSIPLRDMLSSQIQGEVFRLEDYSKQAVEFHRIFLTGDGNSSSTDDVNIQASDAKCLDSCSPILPLHILQDENTSPSFHDCLIDISESDKVQRDEENNVYNAYITSTNITTEFKEAEADSGHDGTSTVDDCTILRSGHPSESNTGGLDANQVVCNDEYKLEESRTESQENNPTATKFALWRSATASSIHLADKELLDQFIQQSKADKGILVDMLNEIKTLRHKADETEAKAQKARLEAAKGGLEILAKVEELKAMISSLREENAMHAGEVYGEKAILATEARELYSRLGKVKEEREQAYTILENTRAMLQARIDLANEEIMAAEAEKMLKDAEALKILDLEKTSMDRIMEASRELEMEAQTCRQLKEFLISRGSILDSLQGEMAIFQEDMDFWRRQIEPQSCTASITMEDRNSGNGAIWESDSTENTGIADLKLSPDAKTEERRLLSRDDYSSDDGWHFLE